MKRNATKWITLAVVLASIMMLSGCKFEEIDQPTDATAGEQITVNLSISTSDSDANTKWGLLGVMIPNDWTVDEVSYDGDFGQGTTHFLHPDSADKYASTVDHWTDSLEVFYPSGDNMHWEVYESDNGSSWAAISYIDATVKMTVGATNGTYELGYFFSEGAMDFTDPSYYADSLGNTITVTGGTAVKDEARVLARFSLNQNYPNPFNPTTNIAFQLAERAAVNLSVFDLFGREVATLVNETRDAGSYDITFSGDDLASGIYFYQMKAGNQILTRKMVLTK